MLNRFNVKTFFLSSGNVAVENEPEMIGLLFMKTKKSLHINTTESRRFLA